MVSRSPNSYFRFIFDDFWGSRRTCENGALAAVPARSGGFRAGENLRFFDVLFGSEDKRFLRSYFCGFL